MSELERLDDRLQQLFAEDRAAFDRRPSGKELALHAVEQRVLLASLGASAIAPVVPPAPSPPPVPPGAAAGVTSAGLAASKGKIAALMALVFSAGFGAGMWVRGAQTTPIAPVVTLAPSTSAPVAPVATSAEASATPTAQVPSGQATPLEAPNKAMAVHTAPSASAAVAAPSSSSSSSSSLAAERDLIDTARAALSRGRADDALAAVQLHATRYPNGSLAEEREFLAIQALSMARRTEAANERAARFHRRYPQSIFGNAIDGLLRKGQ